jgi:hypothetical protein
MKMSLEEEPFGRMVRDCEVADEMERTPAMMVVFGRER